MTTLMKTFSFAALALIALLAGGCVKYKQIVTVMPDGSGKVDYIVGMSPMMMQMAQNEGADPMAEINPENFAENSAGFVAFTAPVKYQENGWQFISFSGYFENINELEIGGPEGDAEASSFVYEPGEGGAKLTIKGGPVINMAKEFEVPAEEEKQMVQQMMAGFEISERFVLPGEAAAVEGVTMADNTAEMKVDLNSMMNNEGAIKIMKGKEELVLQIGETTLTAEQVEAFKAEMAEAIAKWEAMKKEAGAVDE